MIDMQFFSVFHRAIIGLALSIGGQDAFACTSAAWSSPSGATVVVGPLEANVMPSYAGSCTMQLTVPGYVQDDSAAAETKFIAQFYFFPTGGTDETEMLVAHADSDVTTEVFKVVYVSGSGTVDVSINGATDITSIPAIENGWY